MTELKTLKDFELLDKDLVFKDELRQEAIKHIKKLEKELYELSIKGLSDNNKIIDDKFHATEGKIDWIKDFFNITEKDLK